MCLKSNLNKPTVKKKKKKEQNCLNQSEKSESGPDFRKYEGVRYDNDIEVLFLKFISVLNCEVFISKMEEYLG